jgi:hypothetical protein
MSQADLVVFHHAFSRAMHALFRCQYVNQIHEVGTEDNVADTLEWVVSQGADHYFAVLSDPKKMPSAFVDHSAQDTFTGLAAHIDLDRFGDFIPEPDWSR